jgi:hypothetical protein
MNRRELLSGLLGLTVPQQRKLEKLTRKDVKGQCPVCKSEDVLDKFDAVTGKYRDSFYTRIIVDNSFYGAFTPSRMLEVACGQCGACYLTPNPEAKDNG